MMPLPHKSTTHQPTTTHQQPFLSGGAGRAEGRFMFINLLTILSGSVAVLQLINGRTAPSIMWMLICAYWVVLTIKNFRDVWRDQHANH